MPAARDLLSTTVDSARAVVVNFGEYRSGRITDPKGVYLNILRNAYPDYHITEVDQHRVALLEYAGIGKATANIDHDYEHVNSSRFWEPLGEKRHEQKIHPGRLKDDVRFARYQYIWEEKEYIVYQTMWREPFSSPELLFHVLYPKSEGEENVQDGHCKETDELLLVCGKWTSQLHDEVWVFDDGRWIKSKELWASVHGSSWDDVILDQEMKKNIIDDVQGFFNNRELYSQFAVPWKRGIILHGLPGNGKTVSIKALMSSLYDREDSIPALYIKSLSSRCQTEEYSIKKIFNQARICAPCLLIFEDLDSLVTDKIRSYFLNEVDGLESNDGILMIGSTNHLNRLDPAISKRPSRFDRKYNFKLPGEKERTLYAEYWRQKLLKNNTVEFPEEVCGLIANLTEGFSFAYMKELFVMSLLSLVRGYKGEDFEFVDAGEAAGAVKETPLAPPTAEPPATVENKDVCTCNKTCDKCGKAFEEQKKKEAAAKPITEAMKKSKMTMPAVEIPEHLEDNLLLKVVKHHIRVLHSDMDNTKDGSWPSGKQELSGGVTSNKVMRARRAVQATVY